MRKTSRLCRIVITLLRTNIMLKNESGGEFYSIYVAATRFYHYEYYWLRLGRAIYTSSSMYCIINVGIIFRDKFLLIYCWPSIISMKWIINGLYEIHSAPVDRQRVVYDALFSQMRTANYPVRIRININVFWNSCASVHDMPYRWIFLSRVTYATSC